MGLSVSHDAFHGAYSSFARFREAIGVAAGFTYRKSASGLGYSAAEIDWDSYTEWNFYGMWDEMPINPITKQPDPLMMLLVHSDCEGFLWRGILDELEARLKGLLPILEKFSAGHGHLPNYAEGVRRFILGCQAACEEGDNLEFH